jgi:short-chain fatty acids transporter
MSATQYIEILFKRILPSPFVIALLLTVLTVVLALLLTPAPEQGFHLWHILSYWEQGIWQQPLLVFAYQMMLILVLGHILVLSPPMNRLIGRLTSGVSDTKSAVLLVSSATLLVSFFNWGLGLVFGAIMARKVAEAAQQRGFLINYPLVGAAGYVGMMVWHGGISGSAPAKVGEKGHLQSLVNPSLADQLPEVLSYTETVFSQANLIVFGLLLVLIPALLWRLSRKAQVRPTDLNLYDPQWPKPHNISGAERLDHSRYIGVFFGLMVMLVFVLQYHAVLVRGIITPNMLNFFMLGLAFLLHGKIAGFLQALTEAIDGASGILIQFPLYFGIMGIMQDSGLVLQMANFFVSISTVNTLPLLTYFSAALVNIFIPSGGGQWALQGPIILEAALKLNVPVAKIVMAMAYGDQLTNMLQPFWALPLLGITKLKARELLPFSLWVMLVGTLVFLGALLFLY